MIDRKDRYDTEITTIFNLDTHILAQVLNSTNNVTLRQTTTRHQIIGTQQIINLSGMIDSKKTFINNNIIMQINSIVTKQTSYLS